MKLYTYYQSSASYRVRIALNLKNLTPEMEYVNLAKGEQKQPSYGAVNPQGYVPAFIDKGQTLNQSLAIMEYLEESYPNPPILPKAPFARAHARALAQVIACDTSPIGNLKIRKYLEDEMSQSADAVESWMRHWIEEGLAAYEALLTDSSYTGLFSAGDAPSIADCCLMPQIFNAHRWKCPLAPYPLISRIVESCEKHPAFAAAHPSRQKDAV